MVSIVMLYYNIITLWDHRRICGTLLTETSLCGAYLYIQATSGLLKHSPNNDLRHTQTSQKRATSQRHWTHIPSLHKAPNTWCTSRWRSLLNVTSVRPRQRWHRKQTDLCGNATLSEQHCPGYRRCYGSSSSRSCCIDVLTNEKVDFKQHLTAARATNVNREQKNWRIRVLQVHLGSGFILRFTSTLHCGNLEYRHASLNDGDAFWEMRR